MMFFIFLLFFQFDLAIFMISTHDMGVPFLVLFWRGGGRFVLLACL